jgi:hypothetical protein
MGDKESGHPLVTIGRLELVDISEWNLFNLEAKIDTGAYTSSLHCHHIEVFEGDDNPMVRFKLLDPTHDNYNDKTLELPIYKTKNVKSSNGITEERIIVRTKIVIAGKSIRIHLALTDRSEMRYPLLIGRRTLKGRFLVDVIYKYD